MTAIECIKERRSIRRFTSQPVDHSLLQSIIETASYAPSWKNTQVTRYIAVEGDLKNQIAEECFDMYKTNGAIIAGAPMLIAVTVLKNRSGYERDGSFSSNKGSGWQMFDAGISSQTLSLAACEQGLGSVIMGIFDEEKASSLLSIPEERELIALIPIGYPAESPAVPKRKQVDDLLSFL